MNTEYISVSVFFHGVFIDTLFLFSKWHNFPFLEESFHHIHKFPASEANRLDEPGKLCA